MFENQRLVIKETIKDILEKSAELKTEKERMDILKSLNVDYHIGLSILSQIVFEESSEKRKELAKIFVTK